MKIAVLSDTRLATRRDFAGHGLGQVVIKIAEGLQGRGHQIYLWGAPGSAADVSSVKKWTDERDFPGHPGDYEVVLDSTHLHLLQKKYPDAKIVNLSQDREAPAGKNAVYSSAAHKEWMVRHQFGSITGMVIANGIDAAPIAPNTKHAGDYYLYLAHFHPAKGILEAWNAARRAGVRLVVAGPTEGLPPPVGMEYVGPMAGVDKFELMANAKALIYPSAIECSPVTVLEAQSVGTPVLVSAYGGAACNMKDGATGFAARDTLDMIDHIHLIERGVIERRVCVDYVARKHKIEDMINGYEAALESCVKGEVW